MTFYVRHAQAAAALVTDPWSTINRLQEELTALGTEEVPNPNLFAVGAFA